MGRGYIFITLFLLVLPYKTVHSEPYLNPLDLIISLLRSPVPLYKKPLEMKEKAIDERIYIHITFNDLDVKNCRKVSALKTKDLSHISIPTKSCNAIEELRNEVRRKEGNVLLLRSLYSGCDMSKYMAEGYYCKNLENEEDFSSK